MVNYGRSRGCRTCKQRRKKCDEARPSCRRCIKAKRTCLGYQAESDIIFHRHYAPGSQLQPVVQPVELGSQHPGLHQPPANDTQVEQHALALFLFDYCIHSKDQSLSRGYLDNLEYLLAHAEPSSDIAEAAKTVALASLGQKLGDPCLIHRAGVMYSNLLSSFRVTMSNIATSNTVETLTTAVLLGLYEMIAVTRTHPGEHGTHIRGVTAILSNDNSPFSRRTTTYLLQEEDPSVQDDPSKGLLVWPHKLGILCPPNPTSSAQSLDVLLFRYGPIFRDGQMLTADVTTPLEKLRQLKQYAISIDEEFSKWPHSQLKEWLPKTIGLIDQEKCAGLFPGIEATPTRIDTYFDLYVSAIWNSYRKVRLVLLNVINTCCIRLNDGDATPYPQHYVLKEVHRLCEDISASIVFHLTRNPEAMLVRKPNEVLGQPEAIIPNQSIGGLFLMHSLQVTKDLRVVPEPFSKLFRDTLNWIGRVMGIGQAKILADPAFSFSNEFVLDGFILVWAGTLISPKADAKGQEAELISLDPCMDN